MTGELKLLINSHMPDVSFRNVLFVIDPSGDEFRSLYDALTKHASVNVAATLENAMAYLSDSTLSFDLVVIAQSRPGQFSQHEVRRLQQMAPLARFVGLLGSWCEAESRSGTPWPGVYRVYAHQFAARLVLDGNQCHLSDSNWLPTTSDDEHWMRRARNRLASRSGQIVISSSSPAFSAALAEVCRSVGYQTAEVSPLQMIRVSNLQAVVYDADRNRKHRIEQLKSITELVSPASILALVDFPRGDEIDQLREFGVLSVSGKPYVVQDLLKQLDQVVGAKVAIDAESAA